MPIYSSTGAFNVAVNDTTGTGRYSASGALRVKLVSGSSYVGLYAADGALNVIDVSGVAISTYGGLYHPSGGLRGRPAPTTLSGLQAPDGSYYFQGLFSPLNLFINGEQGAWYDPSDISTMFQDRAGTTPVTTVEQPVGLILDKSKGLAIGAELVPSPYVGAGSGTWAVNTTSVTRNGSSTGQATFTLSTTISTTKSYRVIFTVSDLSGDTFYVRLSNGTVNQVTANGTYSALLIPGATTGTMTFAPWGGSTGQVTITNISVREIEGNHAFQATSNSRPTLSARVNQFTYSEQFDNNTVWTKIGGSISTDSVAPDGTLTADLFTEDNLNQDHYVAYTFSGASGLSYTFSVFVKPNGRTWIILNAYDGTRKAVWFNCTGAGSVGTTDAGVTNPTIAAVGGGWYRLTSTRTAAASPFYPAIVPTTGDGVSPPYQGDGTSGFYLWGADLRVTNDGVGLPAYQRIAAATDYDTTGFPLYLRFDGSDDSLATAAIDFSATDKVSLFAGVRKLSDAAQSVVAELTASIALNNGAFALTAPNSAAANYNFSSKGTTQVNNIVTTYTAPLTSVLTGLGDISGPANTLRINGAQVGSVTTTQGTGNYANAVLYIGRRGGTTLPYNGRLYSLIVRGAQSTSEQIASTEKWVNEKTDAY